MNLQVLISTMNQTDYSLLEKMNIKSDAIVINQCDKNQLDQFDYKSNSIKFISLAERGIGLSRNTALMRATSDVVLFADDDVKYVDNYKSIILNAFAENPKADMIVFNVPSTNPEREGHIIPKAKQVKLYNCLRYGTFRMAARLSSLRYANIVGFSLLFGGGAKYGSGEDSIFIYECIKKGLKVYASPDIIANVSHETSCWFNGYTDKYFIDKGALYASLSKRWAYALCTQYALRRRKTFKKDKTALEACKLMFDGIREVKRYMP